MREYNFNGMWCFMWGRVYHVKSCMYNNATTFLSLLMCLPVQFEWTMYPPICKLVLQSYNTSMEDSEEVLDSKMLFLRTLLQDLGAGKSLRT